MYTSPTSAERKRSQLPTPTSSAAGRRRSGDQGYFGNKRIKIEMLEGQSCLISRSLPGLCQHKSNWLRMAYDLADDATDNNKRRRKTAPDEEERYYDPDTLFHTIGRDISINCLIRSSRSDYGAFAHISRGFRSVIRSGEIYRLRRQNGIAEHWIYFSCNIFEWVAYDPNRNHWMTLPPMPAGECFKLTDKESLAVGTELLVFGKEPGPSAVINSVVLRYSILTHSWSPGVVMNSPRCLFGSASLGGKAIVAGGVDMRGTILSTAELYDSETQTWETLPRMIKPRKMCSGVFMGGKFYVIGGTSSQVGEMLTCGEEYDLERHVWRLIPNMAIGLSGPSGPNCAPPLVAVVNNQLYAADYAQKEVRKYDKENDTWITLGRLPERSVSMNGWGIAFRACGERLIVIGGPRESSGGRIELNSWIPNNDPPAWNIIAEKTSGSFVYNCAVMGC